MSIHTLDFHCSSKVKIKTVKRKYICRFPIGYELFIAFWCKWMTLSHPFSCASSCETWHVFDKCIRSNRTPTKKGSFEHSNGICLVSPLYLLIPLLLIIYQLSTLVLIVQRIVGSYLREFVLMLDPVPWFAAPGDQVPVRHRIRTHRIYSRPHPTAYSTNRRRGCGTRYLGGYHEFLEWNLVGATRATRTFIGTNSLRGIVSFGDKAIYCEIAQEGEVNLLLLLWSKIVVLLLRFGRLDE